MDGLIDCDVYGLDSFLRELIDCRRIDGAALGIAKQVLDKGIESLSEKQQYVFEKYVLEPYTVEHCPRCFDSDLRYDEKLFVVDFGHCARCDWKMADAD